MASQRRAWGPGSIRELPGSPPRFEGRLRKVVDGQRLSSPRFTSEKKGAVQDALRFWNRIDENGNDGFGRIVAIRSSTSSTVGTYLDAWWRDIAHTWAANTQEVHSSTFGTWLSDVQLRSLRFPPSVNEVKEFYARLDATADTKYRVHCLLRSAFQAALEEERIGRNPMRFRGAPQKPKARRVDPLEPDQERRLLAFVRGNPGWEPLVLFALDTGARQAELFGVQVRDFDLSRREVHLRRTVDTVGGRAVCKEDMKTGGSWRRVTVGRKTLDALAPLLAAKTSDEHVFTDDGRLWTRHKFYKRWLGLLKAAGIPPHHFHACRHTSATRLLRAGCFLTAVSRRLGHAKPSITLDVYSGYLPSDQNALADHFDLLLADVHDGAIPASVVRQNGPKDGPMAVEALGPSRPGRERENPQKPLPSRVSSWCPGRDSNPHGLAATNT